MNTRIEFIFDQIICCGAYIYVKVTVSVNEPIATFITRKCGNSTHLLEARLKCNTELPTQYSYLLLENTKFELEHENFPL
jgi:hypothetical protein